MKKSKPKKPKKRKKATKSSSRRRRGARVRPIVGPFQIELPLQMPLFPLSSTSFDASVAAHDEGAPVLATVDDDER
jgi:hypothetical protein